MPTGPRVTGSQARRLAAFLTSHATRERETLDGYRRLARELPSPAFRYLARLILSDEERHHEIFADLGQTVFAFDDLRAPGMPIPRLAATASDADRRATLDQLEAFAARERDEARDLAALAAGLEPGEEQELWALLVELLREDTERHLRLLQYMQDELHRQLGDSTTPGPGETASRDTPLPEAGG